MNQKSHSKMVPKFGQMSEETHYLDRLVSQLVSSALRELFETKALYQSIKLDFYSAIQTVQSLEQNESKRQVLLAFATRRWKVTHGYTDYSAFGGPPLRPDDTAPPLEIAIPKIKVWCKACGRVEPFGCIKAAELGTVPYGVGTPDILKQIFYFSYSCQSCDGFPHAFLVDKKDDKISLCGRSPIAHVDVPSAIPKEFARNFSDAVVAFQAGQFLAANFLLRVLIEQWVKSSVSQPVRYADKVLEQYVDSLPSDFRSRFPCLREEYGLLSEDLHEATGSQNLFLKVRDQIVRHFEARKLYGI